MCVSHVLDTFNTFPTRCPVRLKIQRLCDILNPLPQKRIFGSKALSSTEGQPAAYIKTPITPKFTLKEKELALLGFHSI